MASFPHFAISVCSTLRERAEFPAGTPVAVYRDGFDHTRSLLRSGAVSGQPLHASHHHVIRTGTPITTAQTATASGLAAVAWL